MSKSDQNQAKSAAKGQIQQNEQNQAAASGVTSGVLNNAQNNAAALLPGITAGYSDIAGTGGGVDTTSQATYSDLATTGGYSPTSIQAMKDEASNAAASTFATGKAQASRTAAATGGYGDTSAIQSQLARQGSEAASRAAVSTDASIADSIQRGKLAGASGLAATQQNVTGNKLAALGGSTNIYGLNEQQVTSTVDQILRNYQQTGVLNNQDLAILTNLANQPGVFDKIVGTIGTLGGAAAGIISAVKPGGF